MKPRFDYKKAAPEGVEALLKVTQYVSKAVDPRLRALVELRVSQINGCAFCLNLHSQEARAAGEDQQRLDVLRAWRETSFFSDRERAALAWAEAVTRLTESEVPEAVYQEALAHFSEKELADLTLVAATMNAWNRVSIAFAASPVRRAQPLHG
jgi:AhpD family alkylhydroperoxidase